MTQNNENRARRLVSRSQAAQRAGVSRDALTKACDNKLAPAVFGNSIDIDAPVFKEYQKSNRSAGRDTLFNDALRVFMMGKKIGYRTLQTEFSIGAARAQKIIKQMVNAEVISHEDSQGGRRLLLGIGDDSGGETAPAARESARPSPPAPEDDDFYKEIAGFEDWTLRELLNKFGSSQQFKNWLDARKSIEDIKMKELNLAEKKGDLIPRQMVKDFLFSLLENYHSRLLSDYPKTIVRMLFPLVKTGGTKEEAEKRIVDLLSSELRTVKEETQRKLRKG